MNNVIEELVMLGIIDTPIKKIEIDDWFQNVRISFEGIDYTDVTIEFLKCYEVSLNHDETYSKNMIRNEKKDYEYFVQDIKGNKKDGLYHFEIAAWPLNAILKCESFSIVNKRIKK